MSGITLVGPCAAGKSTMVRALAAVGVPAREVAQEHSRVPHLYARTAWPAALVYLAADWKTVAGRRGRRDSRPQYDEELGRLAAAKAAAGLVVHTDGLYPDDVRERILAWWRAQCARHSDRRTADAGTR